MSHLNISVLIVMIALSNQINLKVQAANTSDVDETKRIDMPFIHIGVRKHPNGEKDVDVKAPFVHVHNPAGANNAQVKAPFTKINHNSSTSAAPQPVATSKTKIIKEKKTVIENTTQ